MSRVRRRPAHSLLVVAAIAGCTAAPTPAAPTGGVAGTTTVDAGCPVTAGDTPCPDVPIVAHLELVRPDSGSVVGEATSDADGGFRITAEPGSYLLKAGNLTGAPYPAAPDLLVEVGPGRFSRISVRFDSGVR